MLLYREHRDITGRNKLHRKSSRRRVRQSQAYVEPRHHNWQPIATGRVCDVCLIAQAKGEFDDNVACNPHES